jgi:GNAT superfamily N-acetyltransferase
MSIEVKIQEYLNRGIKRKVLVIVYSIRNKIVSKLEASLVKREDINATRYGVILKSIDTEPLYRGKGLASKLINKLIEVCIELGYAYILLDDATESFAPYNIYYKLGFLIKDDKENWINWRVGIEPYDEERLLKIY